MPSSPHPRLFKSKRIIEKKKSTPFLPSNNETYPLPTVLEIISHIFENVNANESKMYEIHPDRITTSHAVKSTIDFARTLTYGEVEPESIAMLIPKLKMTSSDIFYDLGCGTGKIVVQAALTCPIRASKGIELVDERVKEGTAALCRLNKMDMAANKRITIVQGDILHPPCIAPVVDATVIFINNVLFGPELMFHVKNTLRCCTKMTRLVTLRKICDRHRERRCAAQDNICSLFHTPETIQIAVSWAASTTAYLYTRKM